PAAWTTRPPSSCGTTMTTRSTPPMRYTRLPAGSERSWRSGRGGRSPGPPQRLTARGEPLSDTPASVRRADTDPSPGAGGADRRDRGLLRGPAAVTGRCAGLTVARADRLDAAAGRRQSADLAPVKPGSADPMLT